MSHGNQVIINGYANLIGYTDVTPYEVIGKAGEKTMVILEMEAERDPSWKPEAVIGGFFAHTTNNQSQEWIITKSEQRTLTRKIRFHKDGWWRDTSGNRYRIADKPVKFHDYNF